MNSSKTNTPKPTFGIGAIALAATLTLAACGGGGGGGSIPVLTGTSSTGTTGTSATGTPGNQPVETPQLGGGDATLVTRVNAATYATNSEEFAAFTSLNAERQHCGFGLLQQNALLDIAAAGHANYLLKNNYAGHFQDNTKPFYTGNGPGDRATAAGYPWAVIMDDNTDTFGAGANDITGLGASSVRRLLSAPYHAISLLSPELDVGISIMSSDTAGSTGTYGPRAIGQFNIGLQQGSYSQKPDTGEVQTYPCQGATGTAYKLTNESPNPIPGRDLLANPVGQPVIVAVRPGNALSVTSASMVKTSDGSAVTLRAPLTRDNDSNREIPFGYAVIIPDQPLLPNTQYTVTIAGTNTTTTGLDGSGNQISTGTNPAIKSNSTGAFSKTFSFTTGS